MYKPWNMGELGMSKTGQFLNRVSGIQWWGGFRNFESGPKF